MWKILFAELHYYYKIPIIITGCLILWLIFSFSVWESSHLNEDMIGSMIVAMSVTAVSWFVMIMDKHKTKQGRLLSGLPVSIKLIGFSQLLIVIIFWIGIASVLSLTFITLRPDMKSIDYFWKFITFNGVILFFNADYSLTRDLYHGIRSNHRIFGKNSGKVPSFIIRVTNILAIMFFAIPHAFHFSFPLRDLVVNSIFNPVGAIMLNIFGFFLTIPCVYVYSWRKSFLE